MTQYACRIVKLSSEQVPSREEQLFLFPDRRPLASYAQDFNGLCESPSASIDVIGMVDQAEIGEPIAWITLLKDSFVSASALRLYSFIS